MKVALITGTHVFCYSRHFRVCVYECFKVDSYEKISS